ncbi:hypothetical protein DASC09_017380 [Saccharomycopsis crataegensis]|uniref:DASH complex subunit DAD3 n=1 Tax=Saccharomycopsis crataegensis TaxID=43959 RepID=A0AAV5QHU1_9ASCO|nr:hypothetical protein DASC09_017380 [Saccharomycopsis crataegensis]
MEESIDRTQVNDTEYEVLAQYQLALRQLKKINHQLETLNKSPTPQLIEQLRFLENKIGLLFTLIKSSAFSFIVKHQQDINYDENDGNEVINNGILQSSDGTVNVTLDSTK